MLKKAIIYMIFSALGFMLLNSFVKYLGHYSAYQLVFFRSAGSLFFTIGFLKRNKIPMQGNQKILLITRGLVGVTSMIFFFLALKYLPIGSAVSMRYIGPIFAAIFALFILKEHIKPIQWLFFGIAFSGVVVLKGFDPEISILGLLYILISAVFSGMVYVLLRKIGEKDHPVVVVNYFMIIATLVGGILSINSWVQPTGYEWLMLGSLGVFGYIGQLNMTKAFQYAEANIVAPMKYIEVIFTMLIGVLWFDDTYTLYSVLGIVLIITGLVLNVLVKNRKMNS